MKMKQVKKIAFLVMTMVLVYHTAIAQTMLKGQVVDAGTGEPLVGVSVTTPDKTGGTITGANGYFTLSTSAKTSLVFTYLGYEDKTVPPTGKEDLGVISLETKDIALNEVLISASIVRKDRLVPIAVSNITMTQIEEKLGNQEFPEILKSTPSVYATKDNGGYGDSRITLRGFNSENVGVLINGIPMNDMENGRLYWSNWSGLSEVTQLMQVQRGLGASKLGLSSVGGTINIVTKNTDAKKGGSIYYGTGNNNMQKLMFNISTGLMDNGWAITLLGGKETADSRGGVKGTQYEAWNYFANISKVINASHRLSFTAFGAPQWHNQRSQRYLIEDYKNSPDGGNMNWGYGYINGKETGGGYGYNVFHKPQLSLNHFWTIDDKSSLTTSVYASMSQGYGGRAFGENSNWISLNNSTGKPYADTKRTPDGLFDFESVLKENAASINGSKAILGAAMNSHDWYGVLSSYGNQLTDAIKFTGGFDGRYYKGYHYNKITDLLGGAYYIDNGIYGRPNNTPLKVNDKIGYDETGEVLWTSLFAQAEYLKDAFSAFLSGSFSANFYRWHNDGAAPLDPETGKVDAVNGKQISKWINFLPFSVKGGVNYKFADYHNVFLNGGYFTRAPFFNNSFVNYTVVVNKNAKSEKVYTAEAGYGFRDADWEITFDGYYTVWKDKGLVRSIGNATANIPGINAQHTGLELEAIYKPLPSLEVKGMASVADWIWMNDVEFTLYDELTQTNLGTYNAYLGGVHVGNAAQITAALDVNWSPFKDFRINGNINYFGKNYANFTPENKTNIKDKVDSWQMPDFYTVDLGCNYKFKLSSMDATIYLNANNLFNTEYISDATDGVNHDALTSLVYYGSGRTWTAGLRVRF
jgi:outer membrane receptor for ferrienterochelin and colicin